MKLFDLSPGQEQAKEKLRRKFPKLDEVELRVRVFTPKQRFLVENAVFYWFGVGVFVVHCCFVGGAGEVV